MRKFSLLAVLLLVLVAAFPIFAQMDEEAEPTIAELVVALASADEGAEFTVLLAAVLAADPSLLEILSDPEAQLTVFAPTDAAFVALLEELGVTAEELLADTDTLNAVLAYHVVPSVALDADYFITILGEDEGSIVVGSAMPDAPIEVWLEDTVMVGNATTGYASVVAADVFASNGVVHVIDTVILPSLASDLSTYTFEVEETIADIVVAMASAEEGAEFTVLLAAVLAADESILALLSDTNSAVTVFAPTDAAFVALLEALGVTPEELLSDTELLTAVLAYHVVPGAISSSALVNVLSGEDVEGLNVGTFIPASLYFELGDGVTINGAVNVVAVDVEAVNGVIHVIDAVLIP